MAFTNNPKIVTSADGQIPEMFRGAEAASQSYLTGELVNNVAGAVTVVGTSGAITTGSGIVLGIAQEAASGVTSTVARVLVIKPGDKVLMRCTNNGTDALSSTGSRGIAYGLYVASNVWYMDFNVKNQDAVVFVDHFPDVANTATYWAIVQFVPNVLQWTTGTGS